jgi:ubiquinone/menaquinone biosynthesis C-methylase UbiE
MSNHIYTGNLKKKAVNYSFLKKRLDLNKKLQNKDFTKWLFEKIKIKKNEKILDVGCGEGAQVKKFVKLIGKEGNISCLDINQASINKLKKDIGRKKNIQAIASDMRNLEYVILKKFKQKQFSLAHSSYALYYSPKRLEVLKTMYKFLKNNGSIYVFTPCLPHGMVSLAKKFHKIPPLVEDSLKFGNKVLEKKFREMFWEVQINYFQSLIKIENLADFKLFYQSTTYFNKKHQNRIYKYVQNKILNNGHISFEKNGYLIKGHEKKNKFL